MSNFLSIMKAHVSKVQFQEITIHNARVLSELRRFSCKSNELLGNFNSNFNLSFCCRSAEMRRSDDFWMLNQLLRYVSFWGLFFKHVECCTAALARLECCEDCRLVDDATTSDVYNFDALFTFSQCLRGDEI